MTALAITHVAFEDAGLLGTVLEQRGIALRTCPAWEIPDGAEDAALVILLGGPISVNDTDDYPFLLREIDLARARIAAGRPTIGICLGAQIIACAIGGTVGPGREREIGWGPIDLTEAGRKTALAALEGVPVLHWHGEVCQLPPHVPSLATTPACATQAFAPAPHTLALQFHAEAGAKGIEPWLVGHTAEIAATPGTAVHALRADTARHGPRLAMAAQTMFGRWLATAGVGA